MTTYAYDMYGGMHALSVCMYRVLMAVSIDLRQQIRELLGYTLGALLFVPRMYVEGVLGTIYFLCGEGAASARGAWNLVVFWRN